MINPELKAVLDPIYNRNPNRYSVLIRWVRWQQSRHATDKSIIICLKLADPFLDNAPDVWAYLTKIMPKASAQAHQEQNEEYKKGDLGSFGAIMERIVKDYGKKEKVQETV